MNEDLTVTIVFMLSVGAIVVSGIVGLTIVESQKKSCIASANGNEKIAELCLK